MHLQPFSRYRLIALWLLACLVAVPAFAQTPYSPTSAWLVGPVTQSAVLEGNIPCVAVNQFNNGYIFRLSGGGGQLMAMAIDFKQKAFDLDRKYDVEFSVPGEFFQTVTGTPYDQATLLFNLYKYPDFYKALKKAKVLTIKTGDDLLSFEMAGMDDGFARMESCYGSAKVSKQADNGAPAMRRLEQASTQQAVPQEEVTPANPLIAQAQNNALTPMPGNADLSVADLVLPAEKTPQEKMAEATSLAEKASLAQQTAQQLSMRSKAPNGELLGQQLAGSWTQTQIVRKSGGIMSGGAPAARQQVGPQVMRWRALKGASLRNVLDLWTKGSNRTLIWSGEDFPVTRSMVIEGTFEGAVQKLLEEYMDQPVRPVGRMYQDPKLPQPVLVVETYKNQQ